jgi:hypothetical protein
VTDALPRALQMTNVNRFRFIVLNRDNLCYGCVSSNITLYWLSFGGK